MEFDREQMVWRSDGSETARDMLATQRRGNII